MLSYLGFAPEAGNLEAHAATRAKIDYQHHKLHKASRLLKEPAQLRSCEICKALDLIVELHVPSPDFKQAYPHHQASQWRLMQRPRAVWTKRVFQCSLSLWKLVSPTRSSIHKHVMYVFLGLGLRWALHPEKLLNAAA